MKMLLACGYSLVEIFKKQIGNVKYSINSDFQYGSIYKIENHSNSKYSRC